MSKTNPVGLDYSILLMQTHLHNYITQKWINDPAIVYKCFGRAERTPRDGGYVAELFTGDNTVTGSVEYSDVLWDDEVDVVSFFGVTPKVVNSTRQNADVHLIFFANLNRIKPNVVHRPDEEMRIDLLKSFGKVLYGFHYQGFETGIENVLKEYKASQKATSIKNVDMHPVHALRINFSISYNPFQTPLKLN